MWFEIRLIALVSLATFVAYQVLKYEIPCPLVPKIVNIENSVIEIQWV